MSKRPVLINNWEATYFDFDEKAIEQIAKQASELGIDMMVLDDGWFGKRDTDISGLGDWKVNEKKLKGGLGALVKKINAMGMKFGLWFEPEMISEDSECHTALTQTGLFAFQEEIRCAADTSLYLIWQTRMWWNICMSLLAVF